MANILFISNGSGEDCVSAALIKELAMRNLNYNLKALPLVGSKKTFKEHDIEIIGPDAELPSGGIINNNPGALLKDIKAGLLTLTLEQIKVLKESSRVYDLIVCVGDRYPVILAGFFSRVSIIFVGIAQSVRVHGYSYLEKKILRYRVKKVFTRDEETAENLKENGIKASFVGNPIMDTFSTDSSGTEIDMEKKVIAILPGSRSEVWYNTKICLGVCKKIHSLSPETVFLMALSPVVPRETFLKFTAGEGWINSEEKKDFSTLKNKEGTEIKLSQNSFGWIIKRANVVLGLGGTANEQASGMGKPVVTFWSPERQVRKAFIKHQKKLLGNSLIIVPAETEIIAKKLMDLIKNPSLAEESGEKGPSLMGKKGGVTAIADYIVKFVENTKKDKL
ncbi:MAG TPA: lipid-A-disaccharide synthase-related protein [Candidatus Eremiobacteraeota bacterium]|nr:MAG: lipid-A-disaccharide synthase [bacterium ADurb.Bin363]HPZ08144.1 lipid-A-disaccharide synthase-related protein [Candidatus Eremiobacteraeota bacterium]